MKVAFKKAPKINELLRNALNKKIARGKGTNETHDLSMASPRLGEDLDEKKVERRALAKKEPPKKQAEIIQEEEVLIEPEKPVVKEKWRKRTANFLMKVYEKDKQKFETKSEASMAKKL